MGLNAWLTRKQAIAGLLLGGFVLTIFAFVLAVLPFNDISKKPQTPERNPTSPSASPAPPTGTMSAMDTALFKAAEKGDVPAIRSALQGGANVNARSPESGDTPLIQATWLPGHEEALQTLLDAGADINARNRFNTTALHQAAMLRLLDMARFLIRAHADVNIQDRNGATPLVYLARDTELVRLLLEAGAEVDGKTIHANGKTTYATPLNLAAHAGNAEAVKLLLQAGADVHARDDGGNNVLISAAGGAGDPETMILLLRAGARVNDRREGNGATALMQAAFTGRTEAMRFLLVAGAEVNARNTAGDTTLHYAAKSVIDDKKNYSAILTEMMRILVEGGANVNATNLKGETALRSLFPPFSCPECNDARAFLLSVGGRE